jgi:hypothetical protein
MFRLLMSAVLAMVMLVSTALAQQAPPGYVLRCHNGVCGYERIANVMMTSSPRVVTTQNASYFETTPLTTATPATFATTPVSQTCDCVVTGVCTCDPATCMCPGCRTSAINMVRARAYTTPMMTYTSPVMTYQAPMMTYSTGLMSVSYDGLGNSYVAHAAGKRATKWAVRGFRHGWH